MSTATARWNYYRRIVSAYVLRRQSQLSFWHDTPTRDLTASGSVLGPYYMAFDQKADYPHLDDGVPVLDYHGSIGTQFNPIAIAQYGLGNHTLYVRTQDPSRRAGFLRVADWLVERLELNHAGLHVWNHYFDWDYRSTLKAPWYSGLAQGQGISVLVRAHADSSEAVYLNAAERAYEAITTPVHEGGTAFYEGADTWIEEYIVHPPTHILNGFIWAAWGVYDLWLVTKEDAVRAFFDRCAETIARNLPRYDTGYWSLYELSSTRLPMIASAFYHRLHIVQLEVMHQLTGESVFEQYASRWRDHTNDRGKRLRAGVQKAFFKLIYY